ncbi:site-specific recombinase XerD [Prauserella sediminis]|uniref:Site-specific recombinase XerD n=1 Tax=Prauserella sediminis TaxID=577680 RepID=A0A839XXX1_9PSEU|nr:tyrosine-type recombinase/integrase [Prauserella sediminis]MBB3665918.1 site-specific recombinase XerD [Prauserella sediminis]
MSFDTNDTNDESDVVTRLVLGWLQTFETAKTRNAYASDIGLEPDARRWPGAPRNPRLSPLAFLPWMRDRGIDPLTVTRIDLLAWLHAQSAAGRPTTTRSRQFYSVCSLYRFLRGEGVTTVNPNDMVNTKTMKLTGKGGAERTTRPLTVAQIKAMFTAVRLDGTAHRERNLAILGVLSATGCRAAELVGLDLDHYWRESPAGPGKLRLHRKGGKWHTITVPAYEADLIDAYLRVRIDPQQSNEIALRGDVSNQTSPRRAMFTTRRGQRMSADVIQPMLNRIAALPTPDHSKQLVREAFRTLSPLIGSIHPHQFRHAYAVTAARNGQSVTQIQADLGHESLTTTQRYLSQAAEEDGSAAPTVSAIYHAGEELTLLPNEHP